MLDLLADAIVEFAHQLAGGFAGLAAEGAGRVRDLAARAAGDRRVMWASFALLCAVALYLTARRVLWALLGWRLWGLY